MHRLIEGGVDSAWRSDAPVVSPGPPGSFDAEFCADPFLIEGPNGDLWMFYEGYDGSLGRVGAARSRDGRVFQRLSEPVLDRDPTHSSFPFVFRLGDTYLMQLEEGNSRGAGVLRLFRTEASAFPFGWTEVCVTLTPASERGVAFVTDGVLFASCGRWWAVYTEVHDDGPHSVHLASADHLADRTWLHHLTLERPDAGWGSGHARVAGNPVVCLDGIVRVPIQATSSISCHPYDASSDLAVGIAEVRGLPHGSPALSVRASRDEQRPLLGPRHDGWESGQVHHLSPVVWQGRHLAAYDATSGRRRWRIGILDERTEHAS